MSRKKSDFRLYPHYILFFKKTAPDIVWKDSRIFLPETERTILKTYATMKDWHILLGYFLMMMR